MEQTYAHSTFPNQSCSFTLCQADFCTIGFPTNVHFCHLLEKGFITTYSSDSPQILCKGSVITLFYNCLELLFSSWRPTVGDVSKHARVLPVRFIEIREEAKQNASINFMHANFYFFWTTINLTKLNCVSANSFFSFSFNILGCSLGLDSRKKKSVEKSTVLVLCCLLITL